MAAYLGRSLLCLRNRKKANVAGVLCEGERVGKGTVGGRRALVRMWPVVRFRERLFSAMALKWGWGTFLLPRFGYLNIYNIIHSRALQNYQLNN